MKILLTNDDGIYADGLKAMITHLKPLGDLVVVAPKYQRSALSHSITLYQPLIVTRVTGVDKEVPIYAVEGTPADSVKLALREILTDRPDIVVSGANFGLNTGSNIFYSGTVAAAIEASMAGVTSMAVSMEVSSRPDFTTAARVAARLVPKILARFKNTAMVFNVNVPARKSSEIKGALMTHQEMSPYEDGFERNQDPRGRTYYWIKAIPEASYDPALSPDGHNTTHSDAWAVHSGYVSITPLRCDLTHHTASHDVRDLVKDIVRSPSRSRRPVRRSSRRPARKK